MKIQLSKITIFSIVFIFTIISVFGFSNYSHAQFNIPGLDNSNQNEPDTGFNFNGLNDVVSNPAQNTGGGSSGGGSGGGSNYKPITPGYGNFFTEGITFGQMIGQIFRLSVVMTVVLAVVMMIVGGIQYMGSESIFKKDEGKQRIFAAIGGLLIALVSILVISTILPSNSDGSSFEINIFGKPNAQ